MNSNTTPETILPINLGNPHELTYRTLASKVIELTKSKSKIVFKELPKDDPTKRCPDITKAKNILNWKPEISLEQGLIKTLDYFKN